eukprot:5113878-Lingulodinium_polyedra.AAC.1
MGDPQTGVNPYSLYVGAGLRSATSHVVFCAQKVGQGLELDIERFKRDQAEEKTRAVMGKSAWRA